MRSSRSDRCAERKQSGLRRHFRVLPAAALIVVAGMTPRAAATDPSGESAAAPADVVPAAGNDEARRLAKEGLAHFDGGRYDDAIRAFEASYRLTPAPGLLYNLAQANRLKGDCENALALYRRFLLADPNGNIRQRTLARIAEMELCASQRRQARAAPPAPPVPPPGLAAPPPTPVVPLVSVSTVVPPRHGVTARRWTAAGLGGAAVVMAAASGYFAWRAGEAADDVSRIHARGEPWGYYAMARERDGESAARWALAMAIGGAISAAVSAWLFVRR